MNEFDTTTDFMPIEEFLSRNPDYASATSQMDVVAFPQNVIISSSWLRQKYGKKWTEYARLYKDSGYHVWLKSPDLRDLNEESLRRDGFTLYDPIEFVKKKGYLTDEEVPSIFAEHSLKTLPQPSKPNVIGEFALKTGEFVSGTYENIKQGVESFYHGTPYAKLFGFYGMMDLLSHPEEIEPYLKYSNAKAKKTFTDAWKLTNTVALAYSSPITFLKNTITTSKVDFPIKEDPSFQVLKSEMHELTQDLLPVVKGASALTNILWSPAIATFDSIDNAIGIATNRLTNPSFAREHPSWYNFLQRPTGEIFGLFTGALTKSLTTVGVHEEVAQDLGGIASAWLMGKVIDSIGGKAKLLPKMLKKEKVREPIKEFKEAPEEIQVPEEEVDMLPEEERIAEITDEDIRRHQEKKQKIGELAGALKKVADRKHAKELREQPTTEESGTESDTVRKASVSDLIIEGKTDEAIELLDKKRETLELDLAKMDIPKKNKDVLLHIYNNFTEFLKQKLKEYKENGLFEKYNNISPNYFAKFNSVINVLRDTLDKTDRFINEINQIQVDKKGDKLDIITPTSELTPETKGAIADKLLSHATNFIARMVENGEITKEEAKLMAEDTKNAIADIMTNTKEYESISDALQHIEVALKSFINPAISIHVADNLFGKTPEFKVKFTKTSANSANKYYGTFLKKVFARIKKQTLGALKKKLDVTDADILLDTSEKLRGLNIVFKLQSHGEGEKYFLQSPDGSIIEFIPSTQNKHKRTLANAFHSLLKSKHNPADVVKYMREKAKNIVLAYNIIGGKRKIIPKFNFIFERMLSAGKKVSDAIFGGGSYKNVHLWDVYGGGMALSLNFPRLQKILKDGGKVHVGLSSKYMPTESEYVKTLKALPQHIINKIQSVFTKLDDDTEINKVIKVTKPKETSKRQEPRKRVDTVLLQRYLLEHDIPQDFVERFLGVSKATFENVTTFRETLRSFKKSVGILTHKNFEILDATAEEIYSMIDKNLDNGKHIIIDDSDYPPPAGEYTESMYAKHENEPYSLVSKKRGLFKKAYEKGHTIVIFNQVTPTMTDFLHEFDKQVTYAYKIVSRGSGENYYYGGLTPGRPEFFSIINRNLPEEIINTPLKAEDIHAKIKLHIPKRILHKIAEGHGDLVEKILKHEAIHFAVEQMPIRTLKVLSEIINPEREAKNKSLKRRFVADKEEITNWLSEHLYVDTRTGNIKIDDSLRGTKAYEVLQGFLDATTNIANLNLAVNNEGVGGKTIFRFMDTTDINEGMLEPITYEQIKNSGEVIWHVSEEERGRTTKGRLRTLRYAAGKMLANIHKDLARAIEEEEIKPVPENMPLVYGVYNNKTGEVKLVADKKLPMAKLLTNKNEIKKLNSELAKIWTKYKGKDKDEKYVGVYRYRVIKTYSNLPVAIAELTGFEKPAKKFKTYQAIAKAVGSYHRFFFSTSQKEVDAYVDKIKQDIKDGKYPEDYDLILMTAIPRTGRGKVRDIGYIVAPSMQEAGKLLRQYPFKTALGEKGFAIDRIVLRSEQAIKTVGEVIKADEKQQEPLLHNVVNKLEGDEDANTVAHYIGEKPSKYMPQLVESVIENMKVVKDKITGMPRTLPSKISALVETVDEEVKRRREYFRTSKIGQAIKKTLTPNQRATLLWGMVNPVTEYGRILSEKAFKSALIKDWLNKKVLSKIPKLKSESLGYLAMIMSEPETKERITEMISLKKEQSELFRQANTIVHNIYERANITRTVLENALEILDAKHGESIEALKKYFPDMKDSEYSKMRTRLYEIIDKVEDVNKKIEASNVWWNEFLGNLLDTQITLAKTDDNIGVFLLAGIDTERLTGDMKEAYGEFLQSERAQELLDRYGKEIQYIKEYMAHAKHEMQISGIHTREGDYLPYFLPDVFFKDAKLGHRNAPYVSDWFARHMPIPLYPDLHQALMKYVDLHRTKVDFSDFIWKWRQRIAEIKDHEERAYWKNWMDTNIAPERLGSIEKFVNNVKNFMAMKLLLASFSAALKHMVKFTLSFQAHGIKGMSYGMKEFAKGVFGKGGIAEVFWKEGAKDKIKDFLDKHNNIITKVVDNKLLTDNPKERKTLIELYDKLNPNAKLLMQFLTEREALRSLTERIDDWDTMIRTGAVGDTKFVADILEKVGIDRKESVVVYNNVKNKGKKFINEVAKRLSFVSYVELVENGINVFATMHSLAKTGKVDAYDVLQFKDAIMNSILLHNFRGGYDSWLAVKNPYIGAMTLFQTTPTKIFLHSAYSLLDSYLDLKTEGVTPFFNKAAHDPYSMGRQLFRLMFVGGLLLYTVDKKFKTHFIVDLLPIPFTTDWVFGKGAFMNKGIYISPMFQVIWSANEKGIGKALKRELTYWGGLTKLARIIEGDIPKIYEGDAIRYLFSMPKEFPAQKKKKGRHKQYHMNMKEPEMIDFSKTTIGGLEYVDFSKPLK